MDVTRQYLDGGPNWRTTEDNLRTAVNRVDAASRYADCRSAALRTPNGSGFLGSPTVLIDGVNPFSEPAPLQAFPAGSTAPHRARTRRVAHGATVALRTSRPDR